MCLIVFSWRQDPDYPLVIAANRDEFHARPAEPLGWWKDHPSLLGGRDLQAGGSWLGISRRGHVATVTNFREDVTSVREHSRGDIVTGYLRSHTSPQSWLEQLDGERYAGFSALASDGRDLAYASNRGDPTRLLDAGLYGLSNSTLNTPWPKLVRTRERLGRQLQKESPRLDDLLDLMDDRQPASEAELRENELPFAIAPEQTAPLIVMPDYGTRCTTALVCRADGHVEIAERRFSADGEVTGESRVVFLTKAWMGSGRAENAQ